MSEAEFGERAMLEDKDVSHLLNGRLSITVEVAKRLERIVGGSVEFWLARDYQYREDSERILGNAKDWLRQLPVSDMKRFGWLEPAIRPADEASRCLEFFNVRSVGEWYETYNYLESAVLFRKSECFESRPASVAAWLRYGEREAEVIETELWDSEKFRRTLTDAKKLSREKDPTVFIPQLRQLCANCGVALVIARTPSGCPASGATKFVRRDRSLLMLSFRHLSDDHFWFSFFHEAAHLLLHHPEQFVVEGVGDSKSKLEVEANEFAREVIVPPEFEPELLLLRSQSVDIIRFAKKVGVSPGLVVGQLQHREVLGYNQQNQLKRRYSWS